MAVQYNLPSPSAPMGDYNDDPTPLTQPFLDASVNGSPLLEYLSQTKARQQNRLRILGIPFSALMLFSICWLTFGSYWVFDTPGAIENQLHNYFNDTAHIDYTKAMNLNLYSIYSWPNTVLAFFGGFIIDQITGIRMGALIFGSLIAGGQVLFAIGIQYELYWLCFAGRFVFGLGGESLTVAQNAYTVRWFDGPILALVFGLVVAFARVGSSINFVVTPQLANGPGVPFAVWFGAGMCGISLCFCVLALFLDMWGDRQITKQRAQIMSQLPPDAVLVAQQDDITENTDEIDFVHNCFSRRCPTFFWNSIVKEFGIMAWLLFLITLFFYVSILAFYQVASDIMQKTGNKYSDTDASLFLAIPNFVAIVASPAFGYLVDKVGRALYWICIACCMFVCGHIVFVALAYEWIHIHPAYIMVWLGFGYSLGAASLWPILAYIIDKKLLGTAYGCMTAVQNTGLAVFPLIIGQLQDAPGIKDTTLEYTIPILIFIGCSGVAFAFTIVLMGIDRARGGKLNASAKERAIQVKAEEERVAAEQEQTRMDQEAQPKHVVMG